MTKVKVEALSGLEYEVSEADVSVFNQSKARYLVEWAKWIAVRNSIQDIGERASELDDTDVIEALKELDQALEAATQRELLVMDNIIKPVPAASAVSDEAIAALFN